MRVIGPSWLKSPPSSDAISANPIRWPAESGEVRHGDKPGGRAAIFPAVLGEWPGTVGGFVWCDPSRDRSSRTRDRGWQTRRLGPALGLHEPLAEESRWGAVPTVSKESRSDQEEPWQRFVTTSTSTETPMRSGR